MVEHMERVELGKRAEPGRGAMTVPNELMVCEAVRLRFMSPCIPLHVFLFRLTALVVDPDSIVWCVRQLIRHLLSQFAGLPI